LRLDQKPIRKGGEVMKLLKIEESQGFYSTDGDNYKKIDEINKDDLLKLVDITLSKDVEFDDYDEELLGNQAHQVVYKSILAKLKDLDARSEEFLDQSERLFLSEFEKYKEQES